MSFTSWSRSDLKRLLLCDKDEWHRLRKTDPNFNPSLEGIDLSWGDLSNLDLSGLELSNSRLCGTNLENSNLCGSRLVGADLSRARVNRAIICDANLSNAKLESVEGIEATQLARSNLKYAQLPTNLKFETLNSVEDISKNCRSVFFAFITFTLLIVVGSVVRDDQLILNSGTLKVPFINSDITIFPYFIMVPFLYLFVFMYFHLHLQGLWRGLSLLPAYFPDGRTLGQTAFPWLLNGMTCYFFKQLSDNRLAFRPLRTFVRVFMVFWLAPIILVYIWILYLPKHDVRVSITHLVIFLIISYSSVLFWVNLKNTLRASNAPSLFFRLSSFLYLPLLGVGLLCFSLYVSYGPKIDLRFVSQFLYVDVTNLAFAAKPKDWDDYWQCHEFIGEAKNEHLFDRLPKPSINRLNLNHGLANYIYLVHGQIPHAQFVGTQIKCAQFQHAILNYGNFQNAEVSNSSFFKSDLTKAIFDTANIDQVNFYNATIHNVSFRYKEDESRIMTNAVFDHSNGKGVFFENIWLEESSFDHSEIIYSQFLNATLSKSTFNFSDLEKSRFIGSNLSETNFSNSTLESVHIKNSILRQSIFDLARIKDADLSSSNFQLAQMIRTEFRNSVLFKSSFRSANLADAKLIDVDADFADFGEATLIRADMRRGFFIQTIFHKATLDFANLFNANLSEADLTEGSFVGASFIMSNLDNAYLGQSDFSFADFSDASLLDAFLNGACLDGANLSTSQGLTIPQLRSSYINFETKLPQNIQFYLLWNLGRRY